MSNLLQKVEAAIAARRLFRPGESILVAVSGGLDSMVLLHLLSQLSRKHRWRLAVAHFNHQLRGRSSDADERFVRRAAEKLGLPVISGRADVREHARRHKSSVEMAARRLRHAFLAYVARKRKIRIIALAHHADDQVELFFLRLFRGAGSEGLAGMKWQNPSPVSAQVRLTRPLLDQPKAALLAWAKGQEIAFREDATNALLDIQRNRIRHELLPMLSKKYQPALAKVILRQMEILSAESEFVEAAARKWRNTKRKAAFASLPMALQRRCLQLQLIENGVAASFELVEKLRETADRPVVINDTHTVSRNSAGQVQLQKLKSAAFNRDQIKLALKGRAGECTFGKVRLFWQLTRLPSGIVRASKKTTNCEQFDADKVGGIIRLRHWRPGDRFQPIGMERSVKLQDLFTNAKVPHQQRHDQLVATTATGELFWVEGLRLAERFKLDKSTSRRLQWRWERV